MAMLDGLRNIFIESLKFCKSKVAYDILVEKWNKECEEVYKYKQSLIAEEQAKHKPTADVVEVRHGEWNKNNTECSCCKMMNPTIRLDEWDLEYRGLPLDYCPNCGAKMDGGKKK